MTLRSPLCVGILAAMSTSIADGGARAGGPEPGFLKRLTETRSFMLGRPSSPLPTPDGKSVLFLRSPARDPVNSLYELDVATGTTRELLTPKSLLHGAEEKLSPEERARRERMRVSSRGFTSFAISDDGHLVLVLLSGRAYTLDRTSGAGGAVRELPAGPGALLDPKLSANGKYLAYVRERDLYTLELASGKETRLTTSSDAKVTNGLAEFIAQEELSRFTGYWWSPDGTTLAYEEADSRAVEELHLADPMHPERAPQTVTYPRPGKPNATLRMFLVAATGGAPREIVWDAARLPYLGTVSWSAGGPLTLVALSREQQDLAVLAVDDKTGSVRVLHSEHDDAFLDLDPSTPRWLPDGSGWLWSSDHAGARRLELHGKDGKVTPLPTPDGAEHRRLVHVDGEHHAAWTIASPVSSEQHLYRIPLDGKPGTRITHEPGVHSASFGRAHDVFALTATTLAIMPRTFVHSHKGTKDTQLNELPSVAEEPPFTARAEIVSCGNFRCAIVRPRDFTAGKKYPVIVDVYGGPHHISVEAMAAMQLMRQWMADAGYIVVASDNRGTPARGHDWARAIRGDFAQPTLDDQVAALSALGAAHAELDLSRVGIVGWSFGGYMAALAVMRRPDIFHVGVAGAPVVDWADYDTAYTERYLGLPDKHAEAYRLSSLLTYAKDLTRPLLLIHGTADDNVYFLHSLKLADALFRAGKRFDLLPLSGLTHMVPDPLIKERLQERIMATFAAALQPPADHRPIKTGKLVQTYP